jgi:hypothetical protein
MDKLRQYWPALAIAAGLLMLLAAAQIAIYNTKPICAAELDARLAQLQQARETARLAELRAARAAATATGVQK